MTTVCITTRTDLSDHVAAAREALESATFVGEGEDRVTDRSYPRALAEAMAVILRERGLTVSVAPDCEDNSQSWLYAYEG